MRFISAEDVFLTFGAVLLTLGLYKIFGNNAYARSYASTRIGSAFEDLPVMDVNKCINMGADEDCCWAATNGHDTIVSFEAFTHCKSCGHPDCTNKDVDAGFHPII